MSDFWDKEELIGKIEKNNKEEVHVKVVEKKGKKYVDIRIFWLEPTTGEFKPSQKGLALPFDNLDEFRTIIEKI